MEVRLQGQFERPLLRLGGLERPFAPTGPLQYSLQLPLEASGVATVLEGEQPRLRFSLPAPAEWRLEDGQANLERLSEATGGRLLASPAELATLPSRGPWSLRPILLALALVCFLLERRQEYLRNRRLNLTTA
ncbi:hypothetical protein Mgrana_02053 [Meiothermus granaticius NBRC 107808]|uniref:Uncharacterized protein n=1 Tax=Meiothermus granaticius NBRC 107808 TaxID=1227551 RepID=A0A399FB01_9DEIN|nr:hypothetical protein Mgrana_02053 [Meiothermus granaticius NBRC 107808]